MKGILMQLDPTRFTHIARNLRSSGSVQLVYPLRRLLRRFAAWFLLKGLARLQQGTGSPVTSGFLQEYQLQAPTLSLERYLEAVGLPPRSWDKTLPDLQALAGRLEDIANP